MVKVNCAVLPPNLVETELFGHERGAFTGADRLRRGRFELADGGTLFLDEISELPLELQAKLLRVLQEGEFERVGGDRTLRVNVRVIAATNRQLRDEVARGRFREDLYYRLHVFPLTVPPLRKRKEDIPALVHAFVRRFARVQCKAIDRVPQAVLDELMAHDWPGNIRELENIVERAAIGSTDGTLRLAERLTASTSSPAAGAGYQGTLQDFERRYILEVLEMSRWRIEGDRAAAERLGLHPNTLRFRMRKLGIQRPVVGAARMSTVSASEARAAF
jgi:transcriptional regulator with GAF, ATPase, and Fis domain